MSIIHHISQNHLNEAAEEAFEFLEIEKKEIFEKVSDVISSNLLTENLHSPGHWQVVNQALSRFAFIENPADKTLPEDNTSEGYPDKTTKLRSALFGLMNLDKRTADLPNYKYPEAHERIDVREEDQHENLNELSKATLSSFLDKAQAKYHKTQQANYHSLRQIDDKKKRFAKGMEKNAEEMRKWHYLQLARKKLNEEVELDEKHIGFEKLEGKLKDQGVKDPAALAAAIGRKKYGKEKFQKAAEIGKRLHENEDPHAHLEKYPMTYSKIKVDEKGNERAEKLHTHLNIRNKNEDFPGIVMHGNLISRRIKENPKHKELKSKGWSVHASGEHDKYPTHYGRPVDFIKEESENIDESSIDKLEKYRDKAIDDWSDNVKKADKGDKKAAKKAENREEGLSRAKRLIHMRLMDEI